MTQPPSYDEHDQTPVLEKSTIFEQLQSNFQEIQEKKNQLRSINQLKCYDKIIDYLVQHMESSTKKGDSVFYWNVSYRGGVHICPEHKEAELYLSLLKEYEPSILKPRLLQRTGIPEYCCDMICESGRDSILIDLTRTRPVKRSTNTCIVQ